LEKLKAKDAQLKKLEGSKEDSDKLAQAKTLEVIVVWIILAWISTFAE
jgi:hypothetical protein